MKKEKSFIQSGKKLSSADLKNIKGGTSRLACTIDQQEACTIECVNLCGVGSYCDRFCRCVC